MTPVVVVVALVVVVATYLTWLASRLDRLASRVEAARAGLVSQLVSRADAADALAGRCGLADLAVAVKQARLAHPALLAGAGLDAAVEDAENGLSRALRSAAVAATAADAPEALHALDTSAARVALARQFHNDAVRDVRALRGRRVVRLLHLSGRHPVPAYFEIDDALPEREEDDGASPAGRLDEGRLDEGRLGPSEPSGAAAWDPRGPLH
jgi:hypothetical protein